MYELNKSPTNTETKEGGMTAPEVSMNQKGINKQGNFSFLFSREQEFIFDFLCQCLHSPEQAYFILRDVAVIAKKRFAKDSYQRYARIWLFQIALEQLEAHAHTSEKLHHHGPLTELTLRERAILILYDRVLLPKKNIATILGISLGGVDMLLLRARENLVRNLFGGELFRFSPGEKSNFLRDRILLNQVLDGESKRDITNNRAKQYYQSLQKAQSYMVELPSYSTPQVLSITQANKAIAGPSSWLKSFKNSSHRPISWQYKLMIEGLAFFLVGVCTIFILPILLAKFNGNHQDAKKVAHARSLVVGKAKGADSKLARGIASIASPTRDRLIAEAEQDEFENIDFPSGHDYRPGTAPIAPSRRNAAVYRLIITSESPKKMIPTIRSLFAIAKVKEKSKSGELLPGGAFFDGITTEAQYQYIYKELQKHGKTSVYLSGRGLSSRTKRRANQRTRVIIWVQQI